MTSQLPLGFDRDDGFTLETFYAGPNAKALETLREALQAAAGSRTVIEGAAGTGKTHLMQALCGHCVALSSRVAYLPLRAADEQFKPSALQGLEKLRHVFLDDVDAVAGQPMWERELAERLRAKSSGPVSVVLSSTRNPGDVGFEDRWLRAYVERCRRVSLEPLGENEQIWALQRHAESRGIKLAEDVGRYLVRQLPGNLGDRVKALDALDYASLANKRRFTKPFIRSVLKPPTR
jgi:DnaA family protein